MAAPKRFAIPSLSQMENDDNDLEKDKGSLFKRHKSSNFKECTEVTGGVEASNNSDPSRGNERTWKNLNSVEDPSSGRNSGVNKQNCFSSSTQLTSDLNHAENFSSSYSSETSNDVSKSSTLPKPGSSNSLIVNPRQRGNPILKFVRNVPWEYGNIVADYVMGPTNCALFLSLRYHQLHPNYIHDRLKKLGQSFELRVMLVQVDVKEPHHLLKDLAKICILADCTLILAFSAEEAGKYLETYKVFENKPAEAIMEKTEDNFMAKFVDCLTRVKSVNKTDCATLLTAFGNLSNIMDAKEDELCLCPGFGPQKAKRLRNIFQEPFLRNQSKAPESSAEGT